jgi:hypothetical protein
MPPRVAPLAAADKCEVLYDLHQGFSYGYRVFPVMGTNSLLWVQIPCYGYKFPVVGTNSLFFSYTAER